MKDLKLQSLCYVRGLHCRRRRACGCYFRAGRIFARVAICSCSRRPCCRRMCVRAEANEGGGVRKSEGKGKEIETGVRTDGVLEGVGGESAGWRGDDVYQSGGKSMQKLMAMFLMKGGEGKEGFLGTVSLQCYEVSARDFRDCRVGMYSTPHN